MIHSKLRTTLFALLFILITTFSSSVYAQYRVVEKKASTNYAEESSFCNLIKDPLLDSLIEEALINNKNVLQAIDRIYAAKAISRVTAGALYPQIAINSSWERLREGPNVSETGKILYDNSAILEATSSWEIDVFGSIRKNVKSSRELYKVSIEELNWVLISLSAQVAQEYVNLRTYQQQYLVTERSIESQLEVCKIAEARYEAGLASKLDLLQANTIYLSSKAQLPLLQAYINQTINAIYTLLGSQPLQSSGLSLSAKEVDVSTNSIFSANELQQFGEIPNVMVNDSLQFDLDIILNRPDIKSQEHTVNSYAALVGASKADWLPKFFLKTSIGYGNSGFSQLFNQNNLEFTVNPTITWTLFSGRALQEKTKVAKSNWNEAINSFNEAVITAMQEVDNAMTLFAAYNVQVNDYRVVRDEGLKVLNLSIELYKEGLQDFQTVLDSQRSLYSYETSLVIAKGARVNALIEFEKALGVAIK